MRPVSANLYPHPDPHGAPAYCYQHTYRYQHPNGDQHGAPANGDQHANEHAHGAPANGDQHANEHPHGAPANEHATTASTPTAIPTVQLAMVGVYSATLALVPQQSEAWQLATFGNGTGTALVLLAASVLMLALARYIRHLARP